MTKGEIAELLRQAGAAARERASDLRYRSRAMRAIGERHLAEADDREADYCLDLYQRATDAADMLQAKPRKRTPAGVYAHSPFAPLFAGPEQAQE